MYIMKLRKYRATYQIQNKHIKNHVLKIKKQYKDALSNRTAMKAFRQKSKGKLVILVSLIKS